MGRRCIAIVGANLAGGRAAETLRQLGFDGRIVLIGTEPHLPYERPPLSKQLLVGTVTDDGPTLRSEGEWEALDVELCLGATVESIEPGSRTLRLESGAELTADQILLCTGSRSRRLSAPGTEKEGVIHLRTMRDATELRDRLRPGAHVVIVGGGLIGAEVAGAALTLGCQPTIVEMDDLPLRRVLGPNLAKTMLGVQVRHGVSVMVGVTPVAVEGDRQATAVRLDSGIRLEADVVVVGIGAVPAVELAADAGAVIDNGIVVDEFCRTSIEGIFAAGDVTNHPSPLFGRRLRLENWDHAQRQAVTAAGALLQRPEPYDCVPWFWSDQHDVNLQVAGLPALADEQLVRGDPTSYSFCEFGLQAGQLVSVTGINRAKDVRRALPLISARSRPRPEALRDDSFDLRDLRTRAVS